ncbi:MAG: hypothetical protein M0Z41_04850 [Peptococcaceae bacterium]|jgi:hypothetical protein|nr:hypothetical protein [Peptococcaceae bacterium]
MPEFKPGDSVRVRDGLMSPHIDGWCIGGWQGMVLDVLRDYDGEETVVVELDSLTLRAMSPSYVYECWRSCIDCLVSELPPADIEPAVSRDTEEDLQNAAKVAKRVLGLLKNAEDGVPAGFYEAWADYLKRVLTFPFDAEIAECRVEHHFREGDGVQVRSIDSVDNRYGLIAEVWDGRDKFYFPLCSLAVTDEESANRAPAEDYRTWFGRYCQSGPYDSQR